MSEAIVKDLAKILDNIMEPITGKDLFEPGDIRDALLELAHRWTCYGKDSHQEPVQEFATGSVLNSAGAVNQMVLTITLGRGESEAVSILRRMINFGLISEDDSVRVGRSDRDGRGTVSFTVGGFLK